MAEALYARTLADALGHVRTHRARRELAGGLGDALGVPRWLAADLATDPHRLDVEPWPERRGGESG